MIKTIPSIEFHVSRIGISENKGVELNNIPNDETIKAIEEVKLGKIIRANNATELIKKLNS